MLFLVFQLNKDRYVIPARYVRAVIPFVNLKKVPQTPRGIAGVLNYHGKAVPVVDLVHLASGRDARLIMSTRIILLSPSDAINSQPSLGLIAEGVTDVRDFDETLFESLAVKSLNAPWLGKVMDANGLIQRIETDEIFPPEVLASIVLPQFT